GKGDRFFRAIATGLKPGTTYYYRLGFADKSAWSAIGSFVTSGGGAAGATASFSFIALTDTQASGRTEAELSAATLAKALRVIPDARFVLHGGDLVEESAAEQDWIDLLDASQNSLLTTTLAPAAGDRDQAAYAFANHFTLEEPNNQSTASGAYYSFD